MHIFSNGQKTLALFAVLAVPATSGLFAQGQEPVKTDITVNGPVPPEPIADAVMTKGPEIKGVISARSGDKLQITATDGTSNIVSVNDMTKIKAGGGLFGGGSKLAPDALLNGLPVTVKTMQSGVGLVASQINFRKGDFKTANMIRTGTAQGFAEQTAATQALRGRMADIDKYNIKSTTNVFFDTGKAVLSPAAKNELCSAASAADTTDNALMLVVGYTDSVGSDDYNQELSEKRASKVINHLQQACRWKPYRMLTPTGMAEADPLASNDTDEGKQQNRRVSVNVLVSKGLDGM